MKKVKEKMGRMFASFVKKITSKILNEDRKYASNALTPKSGETTDS